MSDTVQIPVRDFNGMKNIMNRVRIQLERQQLEELVSEQEAADFMEVKVTRLRNMVGLGTIPKDAYVVLVNGTRKFFKHKLIKQR